MGTRRRYTDEERANALAALAANGGNVERTAAQIGMPENTLRQWANGQRHPEATQMSVEKRGPMADALDAIAWKLLDSLPGKVGKAPLNQAATAMGIAIDKARLLRGEATAIEERRHDVAGGLNKRLERVMAVLGGRGGGRRGTATDNGGGKPVHTGNGQGRAD